MRVRLEMGLRGGAAAGLPASPPLGKSRTVTMADGAESTDSLPTRPSLLGRLANLADDASWREFYLTYQDRIRNFARRRGLQEHDAEDVAQDVFRRVAQTIHTYKHPSRRGAFRKWLFQLARWRTTDKMRRRGPGQSVGPGLSGAGAPEDEANGSLLDQISSRPELDRELELEAKRFLLEKLLARIETSVSKKHLQIFQMIMLDEVPVPRVAELFHTTPAAVYVIKHRVFERLRSEVEKLSPTFE